jgi:carbon storage regulator
MLVLSRKKNESIIIDDKIVITVIEIRGDKVRLGIEAPREVAIHRSEVRDAIAASEVAMDQEVATAHKEEEPDSLQDSKQPRQIVEATPLATPESVMLAPDSVVS